MPAIRDLSTKPALLREISRLASTQHGVVGRAQVLRLGMSKAAVTHALTSGQWERLHRGVYRMASSPRGWHQSLLGACLWGGDGAYASYRAAAALWGFPGFEPGPLEISTTRNLRTVVDGVVIHRIVLLGACDTARIYGIPVTDPTRTLLDLACEAEAAVEAALDDALRRRLTTIARLSWRLNSVGARGRAGATLLRGLLDERPRGTPAPESPLEGRVIRLLAEAGLPAPRRQFEIRDGGKLIARVDLAYPSSRLAIEADGYRYHSGRRAWERDLARRNALEALGWRVLHVTSEQLDHRRAEVLAMISTML